MADENVNPKKPSVDEVFDEALRRSPGEDRNSYVDAACGDDAPLRQRVERLLQAAGDANSFLEAAAIDPSSTISKTIAEKPGDVVGDFRLLQQIGEGGFGVVFMAEQQEPRQTAKGRVQESSRLAWIPRQSWRGLKPNDRRLAMMDHENIAKVLYDGGATDSRASLLRDGTR